MCRLSRGLSMFFLSVTHDLVQRRLLQQGNQVIQMRFDRELKREYFLTQNDQIQKQPYGNIWYWRFSKSQNDIFGLSYFRDVVFWFSSFCIRNFGNSENAHIL